eukprot:12407038-Karenia_brevis.AAC.1
MSRAELLQSDPELREAPMPLRALSKARNQESARAGRTKACPSSRNHSSTAPSPTVASPAVLAADWNAARAWAVCIPRASEAFMGPKASPCSAPLSQTRDSPQGSVTTDGSACSHSTHFEAALKFWAIARRMHGHSIEPPALQWHQTWPVIPQCCANEPELQHHPEVAPPIGAWLAAWASAGSHPDSKCASPLLIARTHQFEWAEAHASQASQCRPVECAATIGH